MVPPVQECHCDVPLHWMRQTGALAGCSFHDSCSETSIPPRELKGTQKWALYHGSGMNSCALVWTQDVRDLKGTILNISRVQKGGIRGGIWCLPNFGKCSWTLISFFSVFQSAPWFSCSNISSNFPAGVFSTSQSIISTCFLQIFLHLLLSVFFLLEHVSNICRLIAPLSVTQTHSCFPFPLSCTCILFSQILLWGHCFGWLYLGFAGL